MATGKGEITQDRIAQLAVNITDRLRESITDIQTVNDDIHVLSINAKIQAAKAGASGKAFSVVADAVRGMVVRTQSITDVLQSSVESTVNELMEINSFLGTKVRGERLSQVAENMIDIVDRNLYERSCDVRWWATGSSVIQALEAPSADSIQKCNTRLGVILDSYTVYYDIVVCNLDGTVVSNGRPGIYDSIGKSARDTQWFRSALHTLSGSEFGFEGMHESAVVGGRSVLIYSCGVRRGGEATGPLIGVLGVVFNWEGLGKVVANHAEEMLSPETDHPLEAMILQENGTVIASCRMQSTGKAIDEDILDKVKSGQRGVILPNAASKAPFVAGFSASRGFETYKTGWYALIKEDR